MSPYDSERRSPSSSNIVTPRSYCASAASRSPCAWRSAPILDLDVGQPGSIAGRLPELACPPVQGFGRRVFSARCVDTSAEVENPCDAGGVAQLLVELERAAVIAEGDRIVALNAIQKAEIAERIRGVHTVADGVGGREALEIRLECEVVAPEILIHHPEIAERIGGARPVAEPFVDHLAAFEQLRRPIVVAPLAFGDSHVVERPRQLQVGAGLLRQGDGLLVPLHRDVVSAPLPLGHRHEVERSSDIGRHTQLAPDGQAFGRGRQRLVGVPPDESRIAQGGQRFGKGGPVVELPAEHDAALQHVDGVGELPARVRDGTKAAQRLCNCSVIGGTLRALDGQPRGSQRVGILAGHAPALRQGGQCLRHLAELGWRKRLERGRAFSVCKGQDRTGTLVGRGGRLGRLPSWGHRHDGTYRGRRHGTQRHRRPKPGVHWRRDSTPGARGNTGAVSPSSLPSA